jgi:hypothetical protein
MPCPQVEEERARGATTLRSFPTTILRAFRGIANGLHLHMSLPKILSMYQALNAKLCLTQKIKFRWRAPPDVQLHIGE